MSDSVTTPNDVGTKFAEVAGLSKLYLSGMTEVTYVVFIIQAEGSCLTPSEMTTNNTLRVFI